jgi:hypothetical protein
MGRGVTGGGEVKGDDEGFLRVAKVEAIGGEVDLAVLWVVAPLG